MVDETESKALDDSFAEQLGEFYPEDKKEEVQDTQESENITEETTAEESSDVEKEIKAPESEETESKEETHEEEPQNIDEEKPEANIDVKLHGYKKEFRELVKSIEDKELQQNLINTSKSHLVDLDRQREDLGENKKLIKILDEAVETNQLPYNKKGYAGLVKNYLGFDALFTKDPKLAIKNLAESANIKLDDLIEKKPLVDDDNDYRTPEEIAQDDKYSKLEEKLNKIERQNITHQNVSVNQELQNFANTKDAAGNLKYPHFEQVRHTMTLFFGENSPLDMTLDKAYNNSIKLDDNLMEQRDADILRKADIKRKEEVAKAKGLAKQSSRSSKVSTRTNNPDANMESIVSSLGF